MSRSQLPLNALRAFEAAARHASFTHAAEELHVTQAAVSHQVKALEERLGVALFVRRPRGLEITSEGEALLPDLRDAFDRMTNALERVGRKANSGTLNVSLTAGPVAVSFSGTLGFERSTLTVNGAPTTVLKFFACCAIRSANGTVEELSPRVK